MKTHQDYIPVLHDFWKMNQSLLADSLSKGLTYEVKKLQQMEREIAWFLMQYKMFGGSTHYIWRTQDDKKVRPSHAANDDKIFAWDDKPATGHPGEDFNCRCWAEPINAKEYANQLLISKVNDNSDKWKWYDFVFHYYFGNGVAITLPQIGLLADVIELAHTEGINQVGERLENQVIKAVKANGVGIISDTFSNGYDFQEVNYVLRISEVYGQFEVEVEKKDNHLIFKGIVDYNFRDFFKDPLDILQAITLLPKDIYEFLKRVANYQNWSKERLEEIYQQAIKIQPDDLPEWIISISEPFGDIYEIVGKWQTKINGTILNVE